MISGLTREEGAIEEQNGNSMSQMTSHRGVGEESVINTEISQSIGLD